MKNLIYIIVLIASTNIYAQSSIVTDELYLKYEKANLDVIKNPTNGHNYELAITTFYSNFTDYKERIKFDKSKDKENWLNKNYKKTAFKSADEGVAVYNNLLKSKEAIDGVRNNIQEIQNELLKKYDANLISETLRNRLKAAK